MSAKYVNFEHADRGTFDGGQSLLQQQYVDEGLIKKFKKIVIILAIFIVGFMAATIALASMVIHDSDNNNNDNSSSSSDSMTTPSPTSPPIFTQRTPKNLIIMIGDGMGPVYNTAFRRYSNVSSTILDQHYKGKYSTNPTNWMGITDSAAGATCFATGYQSHNQFIGIDEKGNPKGTILEAAKRKGKGTGIISTKSVTDATPAAFTTHSLHRNWNEMISKQQATRQIYNNETQQLEPLIDLILGGGRKYYERWNFWNSNESIWSGLYGWNTLIEDGDEVDTLNSTDLPLIGLFADTSFPFYIDRYHDNDTTYPDLNTMAMKGIELLNDKYYDEGFFLMIEGARIDTCGHRNDVVCAMWEMTEFTETVENVINWAKEDNDTLIVILADHETGGMIMGREESFLTSSVIESFLNHPLNWNITGYYQDFLHNVLIEPQPDHYNDTTNFAPYRWEPYAIRGSLHSAEYTEDYIDDIGNMTMKQIHQFIEENYIGNGPSLTPQEKEFIDYAYNILDHSFYQSIAQLMNIRTLTGWTTHGHSGSDVAVHAYGPMEDEFKGFWRNFEIGQLLSQLFDVDDEQEMQTQYLEQELINGSLKICDETQKIGVYEWKHNVSYPDGNIVGGYCVTEWI